MNSGFLASNPGARAVAAAPQAEVSESWITTMANAFATVLRAGGKKAEGDDEGKKDEEDKPGRKEEEKEVEGKKKGKKAAEDEPKKKDKETDEAEDEEACDKEDKKRMAGDDDEGDQKDEKDEKAKSARSRERGRIQAIVSSKAGMRNPTGALHLAMTTNMPRAHAIALLAAMTPPDPVVQAAARSDDLRSRMALVQIPNVDASADVSQPTSDRSAMAAMIIAAGKKRRGEAA